MSPDILAATVITMRPSEVNVKLRKKEKSTSDVKQNPMTDGVGTLVVLALSLCLSVPRRIQTSCVSQRQMPMATPWTPGIYRSISDGLARPVRFICRVILMTTDTCLIWGTVHRLHPTHLVLALLCQISGHKSEELARKPPYIKEPGVCKSNSRHKKKRSKGCIRETAHIKQQEACKRNSSHKTARGV